MSTASLRSRIRRIDDAAERKLAQPEIYAQLKDPPNMNVFCVTIAQMVGDKTLSRRKATKAVKLICPGVHHAYGPGRESVEEVMYARRPKKMVGFMERRRMLEARARARARKAA